MRPAGVRLASLEARTIAYAADEDDRLESLPKNSDERQYEQRPFPTAPLLLVLPSQRPILRPVMSDGLRVALLESRGEFQAPLDARSVHLEKGDTHEVNEDAGDDRERALPDLLGLAPEICKFRVELPVISVCEAR